MKNPAPPNKEISLDEIFTLSKKVMTVHGANEENGEAVAETVTNAERDGSVSHGLFRIPGYIKALDSGKVNGNAKPVLEEISPVIMRCDAQNGFAPIAHKYCLSSLKAAAKKYGLGAVSIQRAHHFAALWPEVESLGNEGLVGFTCVSYLPWVAPIGGSTPIFGTNPFAFAWPRPNQNPMVIDMATSSMAMGEVQIAARDGLDVPIGTGLSASGKLTTNAAEIAKGVLLPFGGHKGSAIALMVELLAGPLVGETFSYETAERDNSDGGPPQGGQLILALSPDLLGGINWANQAEQFFDKFEAIEGVRLPGARRYKNRKDGNIRKVNAELLEKIVRLTKHDR
ncbi:MAG: Delta(1)-pyrroline-2-carboxylate/Delta(1)-piperideine-2-carboxylate reductase [Alphaproteobacteria bacterium MarineAlpha3_Bin5]|nr:oxidoreductase [Magnetovibrio sp.]PPR77783.1 MAG: Delta(1)-pyrroline-2-carboxylate/Delta(1)-piperideine-2-carboxylate reductase [Alphaproteobacteria bacterium MarineAlpha3_Bin5]|tara:strand:- start:788 stop:1810 length:1023 start_codon:yes stop_codon:yes gene_type:complete